MSMEHPESMKTKTIDDGSEYGLTVLYMEKGSMVKVGGFPCQLLRDTPIFSPTFGSHAQSLSKKQLESFK